MEVVCDTCGGKVNRDESRIGTKNYCSRKCYSKGREPRVTIECTYCGDKQERPPSKVGTKNFCKRDCFLRYNSEQSLNKEGDKVNPRQSEEYKDWRLSVYRRDYFTCQKCGQKSGDINAHHIMGWTRYPEARYIVSNGITLCKCCHVKFHSTYTYKHFTEDDLVEYLG